MTTDAVTALLAAPDPGTRLGLRDQFFMILMYDLAARDAEMLALNLADIDTRRLTADLPGKGSKPRRLPITSETARHFGRYAAVFHPSPEPAAPMFYTVRNHRPARMSDDNVARFVRQHATTAKARCPDVPARVHPHMLRHSRAMQDRKSTRLNSSHSQISYAVFCLKKKNQQHLRQPGQNAARYSHSVRRCAPASTDALALPRGDVPPCALSHRRPSHHVLRVEESSD